MSIKQPVVVTTFRGTGPSNAGTANEGDVTLRITDANSAVTDVTFSGGSSPEVFTAVRAAASAIQTAINAAIP